MPLNRVTLPEQYSTASIFNQIRPADGWWHGIEAPLDYSPLRKAFAQHTRKIHFNDIHLNEDFCFYFHFHFYYILCTQSECMYGWTWDRMGWGSNLDGYIFEWVKKINKVFICAT